MRNYPPLAFIILFAIMVILSALPGCDELVTKENYHYDTTYIDSTVYLADTACGICHNDNTDSITIASLQWPYSGHAEGNFVNYDYLGNNTASCGPECHTKEGFVQFIEEASADPVPFPTEIGCFACHAPHGNRDFSLRVAGPICIQCHQQTLEPPSGSLAEITITQDWGPHFSNEIGMLLGDGGYEFAGETYQNSSHATMLANGCTTCHMDTANGFTLGGHSLNISYNSNHLLEACNGSGCHDGLPIVDIASYDPEQAELSDSFAVLKDSLIAANLLDVDGIPVARTISGDSLVSDSAGSLFNYLFVLGDSSGGVHNLPYARDLVNSSLNFLADRLTLTVEVSPADAGTVELLPTGGSYIRGTVVTVNASPNTNYQFDSWSGDLSGSTNPTQITMDSDKTITATFVALK